MIKKIIFILIIIIGILFILGITNKTFFKSHYEIKNNDNDIVEIPIPFYSYYVNDNNGISTFYSLKSLNKIQEFITDYLDDLVSCYDEGYFYDENINITITRYDVQKTKLFNKIYLTYTQGDLCDIQYVLDDNWIEDFIKNADIQEIKIYKCNPNCSVKDINIEDAKNYINSYNFNNLIRIENKENISIREDNYYLISVYYDNAYVLEIFKYDNLLAFKIIDPDDHAKNALYQINENIDNLFKSLWDLY